MNRFDRTLLAIVVMVASAARPAQAEILVGLTVGFTGLSPVSNQIHFVDTANLAKIARSVDLKTPEGVTAEIVYVITERPATGELYGISFAGNSQQSSLFLCKIDEGTGVVTHVGPAFESVNSFVF